MADIVIRFVRTNGFRALSDGDLDGVFASGLLARGLIRRGIMEVWDGEILFPRASRMRGLEISGRILVDLGPERGLVLRGRNLLVGHREDRLEVAILDGAYPILSLSLIHI